MLLFCFCCRLPGSVHDNQPLAWIARQKDFFLHNIFYQQYGGQLLRLNNGVTPIAHLFRLHKRSTNKSSSEWPPHVSYFLRTAEHCPCKHTLSARSPRVLQIIGRDSKDTIASDGRSRWLISTFSLSVARDISVRLSPLWLLTKRTVSRILTGPKGSDDENKPTHKLYSNAMST